MAGDPDTDVGRQYSVRYVADRGSRPFSATYPTLSQRLWSLILLGALISGCAYFNTFYNATTYYETGVNALEAGGKVDSESIPKAAGDAFSKAIEKSLKIIEQFPESRFVDEAFFILGRSHYYRREYGLAERYLRQLLQEYPWSPLQYEARLWLAKVHAQLGQTETVEQDLEPILSLSRPPRELLTEIYMLRGDMALRDGNTAVAMLAFQQGAELAMDEARRAAIYRQLYDLAEEQGDYPAALGYLDRLARSTPSENERLDTRLLRVQLLQEMGAVERAYREIRNMVGLKEFATIIPALQLEVGNIESRRGNINAALTRYQEVIDEFSGRPEASEAAYRAGEIIFKELHQIDEAEGLFKKVKRNTLYFQPAKIKLEQISTLKKLQDQIGKLRQQLGLETFEEEALAGNEGLFMNEPDMLRSDPAAPGTDTAAAEVDTAAIRHDLAHALFRLGEIQLFEMKDTSRALEGMAEIVSGFSDTETAAKAAYVLHAFTGDTPDQGTFWREFILEQYPNSLYGLLLRNINSASGNPELDALMQLADEAVQDNPQQALQLFRRIRVEFDTEQSSFAIAYLYDEYIAQLDSAIIAYDEYLTQYPLGKYRRTAEERLDFLRRIKAGDARGLMEEEAVDASQVPPLEESGTPPDEQERLPRR